MQNKTDQSTKERILEAALEVFADKGFDGATVREICRRAGANNAAVNYHFGDKNGLYLAVLDTIFAQDEERYPLHGGVPDDAPADERLRAFIDAFLRRIFLGECKGADERLGRLAAMALSTPGPHLAPLAEKHIYPYKERLTPIVVELTGLGEEDERVKLCAFSIVGQCTYFLHHRPLQNLLYPELKVDEAGIEALVEHIMRFSLGGLERAVGRAG